MSKQKIHLIAIGGSAMHNLALALAEQGHDVSGSDDEIFEPSKSRLAKLGLLPTTVGWDEKRIYKGLDLVVVGMHAREDNPELKKALDLNIPVFSYPEYLYEASKNKTRVVITGSHGKTSITAMILHALNFHGHDCDYMVGAQLEGFDTMVKITDHNEFMLIEGDEYLSSPLDHRPKFIHYKPNIALLSGIAWDHYNVFPKFEDYYHQFELLMDCIDSGGLMIYNEEDPHVEKVVSETKNEIKKFPYRKPDYHVKDQKFVLETFEGELELKVFGAHNMSNLEGARWICTQMGLTDEEFYEAIVEFEGASKRLETLFKGPKFQVFRDFAHAPSKVKATLNGTREAFENQRIMAVLELHTFSSLNAEFIKQYQGAMDAADTAVVYFNPEVIAHKKLPTLSTSKVQEAFANKKIKVINQSQDLEDFVLSHSGQHEVLLLMSSGNFDGIDWPKHFQ